MTSLRRSLALAVMLFFATEIAARASWVVGSEYHVDFINFPVTSSADVMLDLTTKMVNTNLNVTETIFPVGADSSWIELDFETIDGGPLATSLGSLWRIDISGLDVAPPALGNGFYFYWSVGEVPVAPLSPFGGFSTIAPIPTAPGAGPAYVAVGFPPYGPLAMFGAFAFVSPYSFVSAGGIDPGTANGFHVGIEITGLASTVPEPSTLVLASIGLTLVGFATGRRRHAQDAGQHM